MNSKNENAEEIKDIVKFVEKDFLISEGNSLIPSSDLNSLEEFRLYLTAKLKYLLDEKYDTLINVLYKIDISEEKVRALFSGKDKGKIPGELAELIISRQLQKIHFRKLYRDGKF
jgi:hypothetical protein